MDDLSGGDDIRKQHVNMCVIFPELQLRHPEWIRTSYDQLMDEKKFNSEDFQLVFQTLSYFARNEKLDNDNPLVAVGSPAECISCLLK